jgi:Ca-activated chloride channel family protein
VAERTLTYASDLTAAGEQPHPGAIRDALAAVTAGSRLAPQARNWARLREQLEAYLPDEPPPEPESDESEPPEDQPQDESSDESNEGPDGEPSEGEGEEGESSESSDPSDGERESDANESESGEGDESDADTPPPAGAEAFGDMSSEATDAAEPPPAQDAPTQTVGGQPDRSPPSDDPAQTALLQKLDEVRKQDAPARLFQLMQDPREAPPPPPGRNW